METCNRKIMESSENIVTRKIHPFPSMSNNCHSLKANRVFVLEMIKYNHESLEIVKL